MSSNAEPVLRFCAFVLPVSLLLASPGLSSAQESEDTDSADKPQQDPAPRGQFEGIDLSVTVPKDPSDELLERDCEEEADAGRIAGEIVVCRELGEASDGSWNKAEWQKRYAEKTKGGSTPNTFGIPDHGNPIRIGSVPPPAIFIDVEALPQAPAGSDADRIARGLPPLGKDPEPTPEEIAERRRALGLPAPPTAGEPE